MRTHSLIRSALVIAAGLLSLPAVAQPPHRRAPPPEAIQACASKSSGAACTVTLPDRQVEGTCEAMGETLACRPAHPHGPPPEAIAACQGQQDGATCSMTHHGQQIQGQCRTGPDNQSACVPEHMQAPPGQQGGPRSEHR
jgi:hypothetical protein